MEAFLNTPSGRISLGTTAVRIGSDTSNKIVLADAQVAPVHAEITPAKNGYQLTDLDSSQGVLINGQRLFPYTPQQLQNGDVIATGNNSLIYRKQASEASNPVSFAASAKSDATDRAMADLPTDTGIPVPPGATTKARLSRSGELSNPMSGETVTAIAPTSASINTAPASTTPALPGAAPAYAIPLAPTPVPQVFPAQGYPLAGMASYPTAPEFSPVGAASGMLVQPGYPAHAYAPGGYTLPGQFQATVAKTSAVQKRERTLRWMVVIIVVLLLLGASNVGSYAFARATTPKPVVHTLTFPSPQKALQTYCQGIMTGNSEEIYDLLSDEAKVHTSLDDVQKIFDELKLLNSSSGTLSAQYSNCGFDNIRTSNSLAVATVLLSVTLTIQLTSQGQKQSETTTETEATLTSLVWEHNQWKIDFTSLLQSQLKMS